MMRRRARGAVTVFLALCCPLITALLCTCLEGARLYALRALLGQADASAMQSVFAAYNGDLWEFYGLAGCEAGDGEEWLDEAEGYLYSYLVPSEGLLLRSGDRVGLISLQTEGEAVRFIDRGGSPFAESVLDYMEKAGLVFMVKNLLKRLGVKDEKSAETLRGTLERFTGDEKVSLEDVLQSFSSLKKQAEEAQKAAEEAEKAARENGSQPETPRGAEDGPGETGTVKPLQVPIMSELQDMSALGIMSLIADGNISVRSWRDPELPSAAAGKSGGQEKASVSFGEKLLLGEYIFHTMDFCGGIRMQGAKYEAEYVIAGGSTEAEALERTAVQIMLIRTGLNLVYLMTDGDKLAAAESAAYAAAAAAGAPELGKPLKYVLLSAWALGESVTDLRCLYQGGRVPLWKTAEDWSLSALSLTKAAAPAAKKGLYYEDYLRLLFCMGDSSEMLLRMMDVIEARIRLTDRSFRMSRLMVSAEITAEARVEYLYLKLPWFRRLAGTGNEAVLQDKRSFRYGGG